MAAARQVRWTQDADFDRECALPLLVETARLWQGLGYVGADGHFHIDGVTGPDEYSALVNDNTFTNLAAANLREAAAAAQRWPDAAADLGVDTEEIAGWRQSADHMAVAYDDEREMPEQDRGSTLRQRWDFAASAEKDAYPLHSHATYFDLYRKQVAKQADLVLALQWFGERFSLAEKAAAFAYAEGLTVRDSSLSASSQAVLAAEVGHLDLAHAYLREAALVDLQDRKGDTEDGLHMASLAGAWIALVCGFGGLRDHDDRLRFAPRLPPGIDRLAFALSWRGCCVHVEVRNHHALLGGGSGGELTIVHHGDEVTLSEDQPLELEVPELKPWTDPPTQPRRSRPAARVTVVERRGILGRCRTSPAPTFGSRFDVNLSDARRSLLLNGNHVPLRLRGPDGDRRPHPTAGGQRRRRDAAGRGRAQPPGPRPGQDAAERRERLPGGMGHPRAAVGGHGRAGAGAAPELLHEGVDEEWSFIQTLRHVAFATDAWVGRALLGDPAPWDPLDLPFDEMPAGPGVPWDRDVRPGLDEAVLALRADRQATVRKGLEDLTDERLDEVTEPVEGPAGRRPELPWSASA